MATLAYRHEGRVYLNATSRCPTACVFCVKGDWGWDYEGSSLLLAREPGARELAAAAEALLAREPAEEAVFCGFGEPTERLETVLETASLLRARRPSLSLRLNTVGLGSALAGRDIAPELSRVFNRVSVSLNTADARQWRELHRPIPRLAASGFSEVCSFIARCASSGLATTATAIRLPDVDTSAVERLARSLGARFRLRPALA